MINNVVLAGTVENPKFRITDGKTRCLFNLSVIENEKKFSFTCVHKSDSNSVMRILQEGFVVLVHGMLATHVEHNFENAIIRCEEIYQIK